MMPNVPTDTQLLYARELARFTPVPDETPRTPSAGRTIMPDPVWYTIRRAVSRLTSSLRREPAA